MVHFGVSMGLWFVFGWIFSSGIFYLLKNFGSVDKGVCLSDSYTNLNAQLSEGYALNFSNLHGECLFSRNYEESKGLFSTIAKEAGARVVDYPVVSEEISQTFAFFQGNPEKVLVHMSGTHGVEAYAGSSAQLGAMRYLNATGLYKSGKTEHLPTIIFIHAVNPYGFYHNRRTNEDNIDLNRNFLTDEEFAFVRARDPNYSKYVELDPVLNPTKQPTSITILNDIFWLLNGAYYMVNYGFVSLKRAMVAGNYHKQTGYGFGGFQRSKSVENILEVLKKEVPSTVKAFYVLDVHTGLGPSGVDTLMFDDVEDTDWVEKIYPTEFNQKGAIIGGIKSFSFGYHSGINKDDSSATAAAPDKKKASTKDAEIVSSGYELTVGTTNSLCHTFIAPHLKGKNTVCVAQEFGTQATFFVGKGSIEENFAHFWGNEKEKLVYKGRYRPLFYVETREWKRRVASRGLLAFLQTFNAVQDLKN